MSSLNKLAENIAYSFNKQFDFTFREIVKFNIQIYRAKLLREEQFNNGLNFEDFSQEVILELEEAENVLNCPYKITKENVPETIRFKSLGKSRFNFIGTLTNKPINIIDEYQYEFIKNINGINVIYGSLFNNKIKIFNNLKLCKIKVVGVFADPINAFSFCEDPELIPDDANYPISDDIFSTIKQGILNGDFPLVRKNEEGVIKTDSQNEN